MPVACYEGVPGLYACGEGGVVLYAVGEEGRVRAMPVVVDVECAVYT